MDALLSVLMIIYFLVGIPMGLAGAWTLWTKGRIRAWRLLDDFSWIGIILLFWWAIYIYYAIFLFMILLAGPLVFFYSRWVEEEW